MVRAASPDLTSAYTYTTDGLRVLQGVDGAVTAFAWDWATGVFTRRDAARDRLERVRCLWSPHSYRDSLLTCGSGAVRGS
jgi:hypothetical protein